MAGERGGKEEHHAFGFYLACFFVILILLCAAILLFPVWRDYRSKEAELHKLQQEEDRLKAERNEKIGEVSALENSPAAVEKVAREKFNLVRPGDKVFEYQTPRQSAK